MTPADTIDLFASRRNRLTNTLHTWLLGLGSLTLLAVTAWAFGGPTGIAYAVIFGGVSMWAVRRISPQMVLAMYKAREVSRAEFPAGVGMVVELARRAGLSAAPKLYVVPSKMMNAFAVGRRDDSAIAITDALAQNLTARELAGVLAHEISHVAHEDIKVMAFADMVARFTSLMSTIGLFSLLLNLGSFAGGGREQVPWLAVLVLLAAPTVGGMLQLALSRTREFDADLGAVVLTGDPDGLASALTKLEQAQKRLWETIFLPTGRTPNPSVLRTHPLTAERVARLMALKASGPGVVPQPEIASARPRPSFIPRVPPSPGPHFPGAPGVHALFAAPGDVGPDGDKPEGDMPGADDPLSAGPLNPPEGEPRIRFRRGGVWW